MNENALATLSPYVRTMAHRIVIASQLILYLVVADDINLTLASVGVLLSMAMTIYLFMNMDDNPTSDGPFLGIMVVAFHVLASIGGAFLYSGLMWSISRFYGILALGLGIYVVSVFMTHRSQILASEPSGTDLKSFVEKRSVALKSLAVPALTLLIGSIITQRYKALLLAEFDGLMAGKYFFAYWMLLPLVLTILSVVYVMKYELNKSTPVELTDDLDNREILESDEIVESEPKITTEVALMDEAVEEFQQKWVTLFDESVSQEPIIAGELPKRSFETLSEQREYLNTIQEKLQNRLKQEFGPNMSMSQLRSMIAVGDQYPQVTMDMALRQKMIHINESTLGTTMTEWMTIYRNRVKPFVDYADRRLFSNEFQALVNQIDAHEQGYAKLTQEMALLDGRSHVLTDVRINEEGLTVEPDVIVVSQYGVFVITAYHKSASDPEAYVLDISKEGHWSQIYMIGLDQTVKPVTDLSAETNRQVLLLQKYLNRVLKEKTVLDENRYIDVTGVVAVTSPDIALVNASDSVVLYSGYVPGFMYKRESIYTPDEVKTLVAEIEAHTDESVVKRYETIDYEAEYEQYAAFLQANIQMIHEMYAIFGLTIE